MAYQLSIEIFGEGDSPNHRSHWGFMIHEPTKQFGDLLNVRLIDLDKLWYQFDYRSGSKLATMEAVGICKVSDLNSQQRQKAIDVIKAEEAPRDGKRRCQDWVLDTLISLEVAEVVPSGTAEIWQGLVGRTATEVERAVGANWIGLRR